ncbi:MAG: uridine kinase [Candidatus Cloacimonadota bacterium]|nr:uridine kinase [Candidatus Cloacimonadota bacterium]
MKENLIIGIAGGTGSGKTTLANRIIRTMNDPDIPVIKMDSYYISHPKMSIEERATINFDHPSSIDTKLFIEHLKKLKNNESIEMPVYDYETHLRKKRKSPVAPYRVIIVEGILLFENIKIRDLCDIKLFVDTDKDICILRRLKRDMESRGRTFLSVYDQYFATVRPMHLEFVEPSKKYADIIVPRGGFNKIAVDMIVTKIKTILSEK